MPTRRAALSAAGLALASLSGCLLENSNDDGSPDGDASGGPAALPEPAVAGDPGVVLVTDTDLAALRDSQGALTELEGDLGDQARQFVEQTPQFSPENADRITAQISSSPESQTEAITAIAVGDFDVDGIGTWFSEEVGGDYDSGEYGDFEWFVPGSDDAEDGLLAVSSDVVLFRSGDPGSGSLESMATEAIDAASSDEPWYADDEHLSGALSDVEEHPNVAAVSLNAGELSESSSSPVEDLAAGAAGTTPRSDGASVDLVARFRSSTSEDAVRSVLEGYLGGMVGSDPLLTALEFESEGSVVRASATVDGSTLDDSDLEPMVRFLPFLYFGSLGSEPEPQAPLVSWDMEQREDGRLEIVHQGGDAIESPLRITYQSDGEAVEETWSEPDGIKAGDSYATERAGDVGTTLRVTWTGPDGSQAALGEWTFVD